MKKIIKSEKGPAAIGPYSQGVQAGDFIFLSGMMPVNPETGAIPDSVEGQTRQVLENVKGVLEDIGSDMGQIVKTTVFIKEMNQFGTINEIYKSYFEGDYPARSCVEVARLPKDVLLEMESIVQVKQ